jgi:hypothetical protein
MHAMSDSIDIVDPVLLIRITQLYRDGMSARELYDATRGVWKVGSRREGARYALAVHDGVVREVYEITEWLPAGSTEYLAGRVTKDSHPGRWEFVGNVAPPAVRSRYLGASVAHYFRRGSQNPVRYVNVPL